MAGATLQRWVARAPAEGCRLEGTDAGCAAPEASIGGQEFWARSCRLVIADVAIQAGWLCQAGSSSGVPTCRQRAVCCKKGTAAVHGVYHRRNASGTIPVRCRVRLKGPVPSDFEGCNPRFWGRVSCKEFWWP